MVLITGATGLLGSHLLLSLLTSGKQVRAIRRPSTDLQILRRVFSYYSGNPDELLSRVHWADADLNDFSSLEDAMTGISEVYHCAAVVSFQPADYRQMLKVNVQGTADLVNIALTAGVEKFCHVSSIATLGRAVQTEICTEETYWVNSKRNSVYSISKFGAEREVWRAMEEGLPAVIINPGVILGPGFWQTNSGLFRLVRNGLKFYTQGVNGFVDVRDVARAMILLMEGGHLGERFICTSANLSYRELFNLMARHFGTPPPAIGVGPALSSVAWRVDALRAFLTRSKPVISREIASTASQIFTYSSEKLIRRLNFSFRTPEETIRDICSIYIKEVG